MKKIIETKGIPVKSIRNYRLNRQCQKCSTQIDDRSKSGLCRKCCRIGKLNGFYNKSHSLKTKKQMILHCPDRRGKNNNFYNKKHTTISLRRMSDSHKESWKNYDDAKRLKILQNWIISGLNNCKKQNKTVIENTMYDLLNTLEFQTIKRNKQINHYNVDFLIDEKTIIECFGDYWHCNPLIFDKNDYNKSLKSTAQECWLKDDRKQKFLEKNGYTYLIYWEYDINNDLDNIKTELCKYFNSKNQKFQ